MAYAEFNDTEIAVGKPVKRSLWQKLKDNFTSHEGRITSLEAGAGKVILFNEIIDLEASPRAGEIRAYLLTDSQMIDRLSAENWQQIHGQSISGHTLASLYGATLPDARGTFFRSFDNGRGLDPDTSAIGDHQSDTYMSHRHSLQDSASGGSGAKTHWRIYDKASAILTAYDTSSYKDTDASGKHGMSVSGGNETRPETMNINYSIKTHENFNKVLVTRVPSDCSIISATVSSLDYAGVAGTLSVDILKGSSLGSLTSMLSSNLELSSASGANATSSEGSFSNRDLTQNDFLVLKLNSMQTRMAKFYVNVYAEL